MNNHRREMLRAGLGACGRGKWLPLLTIALSLMTSVACMSDTRQPDAPAAVPSAGPKLDRVVMALVAPPEESNDTIGLAGGSSWALRPMYESLIGVDPETGKPVPQLATSWKLEPDGSSYRFMLRKSVQLHKGFGEFTAKDLLPAYNDRLADAFADRNYNQYWRRTVSSIDVVNDYEAVYRLPKPDANFIGTYASEETGTMLLYSKAHLDAQGRPTMQLQPQAGTGPYQFMERAQAQFIRFQRVPYQHWRVRPDFPEFEFRWIKEGSTRLAALLTGEVQLVNLPDDLQANAEQRGYKIAQGRVPALRAFGRFHCCYFKDLKDPSQGYMYPDSPLMDVRVRRALSKATDRDAINKAFFRGKGQLMVGPTDHHPTRRGWSPDWERRFADEYGYDPQRARQLLADAGYGPSNPMRTTIMIGPADGYAGAEDILEAMAAQWRSIGVVVDQVTLESGVRLGLQRAYKLDNHFMMRGTSGNQWSGQLPSTARGEVGIGPHLADQETYLTQIEGTLDEAKSDELWRKLGDALYNQHKELPLLWIPAQMLFDPKYVAGWTYPGSINGTWTHVENIKAPG